MRIYPWASTGSESADRLRRSSIPHNESGARIRDLRATSDDALSTRETLEVEFGYASQVTSPTRQASPWAERLPRHRYRKPQPGPERCIAAGTTTHPLGSCCKSAKLRLGP
jgi:hypothetical protein